MQLTSAAFQNTGHWTQGNPWQPHAYSKKDGEIQKAASAPSLQCSKSGWEPIPITKWMQILEHQLLFENELILTHH